MMGGVSETVPVPEVPLYERPPTRRGNVMAATGLASSLLIAILTSLPPQYAIAGPGPTFDTLSEVQGVPLVNIEGAKAYDASGELRLTTVTYLDASEEPFALGTVLRSHFSATNLVYPVEVVFGTPEQQEEDDQQSAEQWISSQEAAAVSALEERGIEVPATLTIVDLQPESDANGLLEPGDIIVAGDGETIATYAALSTFISSREPGDEVTLTVERAGALVDETFNLIADAEGNTRIGIYVDPEFDLPIDVTVQIDSVGGPSAGLMFALAIMDKLSPEDELGGAKVAGTGEIDADGEVYPIGGIVFKMAGARMDGADYFLAPVENCDEVVGHIPRGLDVYAVDTLADAYAAIAAIGAGDTEGLPRCGGPDKD